MCLCFSLWKISNVERSTASHTGIRTCLLLVLLEANVYSVGEMKFESPIAGLRRLQKGHLLLASRLWRLRWGS